MQGKSSGRNSILHYSIDAGKYANVSKMGTTKGSSIFSCSSLEIYEK